MTTPADALRAAGLTVYDERVAPRPGGWNPLAVLWHHVGDVPPGALRVPAPSIGLCQHGRSDLAGPLCQWLVDGDGGWNWITDGRANHAGQGDKDVWQWLNTNPAHRLADPPRPDDNLDTADGNGHLVGIEVEGNGNWSAKLYAAMVRGTQALLDHYQLPRTNVIGHKEWTNRKVDPAGIDMHQARVDVSAHTPQPTTMEDQLFYVIGADGVGALYYFFPQSGDKGVKIGIANETDMNNAIGGKGFGGFIKMTVDELKAVPLITTGQPGL